MSISKQEKQKQEEIKKSLSYSIKDSVAINATAGFGDTFISPYMIAMKASNQQIAMLTSIPNLMAPLAQLFTNSLMEKYSRKKIFGISILIQCLMWIPIILVSLLFLNNINYAPFLVIIFWTSYAFFGNLPAPAWSSWLGDLVKKEEAGRFFGLRNKIGGICALVSMLIAGLILDQSKIISKMTNNQVWIFTGFIFIFTLAMIFRFISRHYVLKQYEPEFRTQKEYYFSFFQFIKKAPFNNYGRYTIYVAFIVLTTNIAGPFFAVYMLKNLNFTYTQFMLVNVIATISTFIFMPIWGKFSDKYGNIKTLKITGFLIPLICFFWLLPPKFPWFFYYILAANFFSGFAWAGFNLAAGNFVYDAATPQRRGLCVAYSSVLNGIGVFTGATIGGLLATTLPPTVINLNVLMFIALVSGISRFTVSFIMLPKLKEVRQVEEYKSNWRFIPFNQIPNYLLSFPIKLIKSIKRKKNTKL